MQSALKMKCDKVELTPPPSVKIYFPKQNIDEDRVDDEPTVRQSVVVDAGKTIFISDSKSQSISSLLTRSSCPGIVKNVAEANSSPTVSIQPAKILQNAVMPVKPTQRH